MQKIVKTMDAFFFAGRAGEKAHERACAASRGEAYRYTGVHRLRVSSGRYDVAGLTVYFFYPLVLIALGELPRSEY
jgi:hypothetical protein